MPDPRQAHPFFMHEEIHLQPEYLSRLSRRGKDFRDAAGLLEGRRRIFLTGCGTSFHAAQAGAAAALRLFGARNRVQAVHAFELTQDSHHLGPGDAAVVMSHSGETEMVLRFLESAGDAGVLTVLLTGFPSSGAARLASHTVTVGYGEERSWAHTISYTLSAAAQLMMLGHLAEAEGVAGAGALVEGLAAGLPRLVESCLGAEDEIAARARELADRALWVVASTGTALPFAPEVALKAAETHYTPAVGLNLEQVLHGYLPMCDEKSLLIVVAPPPRVMWRVDGLLKAAARIGVKRLLVTSQPADDRDALVLSHPAAHELLMPIVPLVPLQLLCYYVTVAKSLNPDLIRRDQPRYREARACYA